MKRKAIFAWIVAVLGAAALSARGSETGSHRDFKDAHQAAPPPAAAAPAARVADREAKPESDSSEAEKVWSELMEGNRRFAMDQVLHREVSHRRQELAQGQHPRVVVLGCADSRVSPEIVFDQSLGDLFVVRTAGNVADPVALGSIEYAVEHLHAPLLIILGHEKCGAVAAAGSGAKMASANLTAIVQKITPALTPMKGLLSENEMAIMGIRANVRKSAKDVLDQSPILRKEVESGKLTLIKAVYQLESGEVMRLD
jgi:carbonic anhydrase